MVLSSDKVILIIRCTVVSAFKIFLFEPVDLELIIGNVDYFEIKGPGMEYFSLTGLSYISSNKVTLFDSPFLRRAG